MQLSVFLQLKFVFTKIYDAARISNTAMCSTLYDFLSSKVRFIHTSTANTR